MLKLAPLLGLLIVSAAAFGCAHQPLTLANAKPLAYQRPPANADATRRLAMPVHFDAGRFTWRWDHPDPRMDALYRRVLGLAEEGAADVLERIREAAYEAAGRIGARLVFTPAVSNGPVPRLTEPWFC